MEESSQMPSMKYWDMYQMLFTSLNNMDTPSVSFLVGHTLLTTFLEEILFGDEGVEQTAWYLFSPLLIL